MRNICAGIITALIIFCSTNSARAQDVTLTSADNVLSVSGTLLGFDGEFYRLRSEFGDLTLDGTGVTCTGPGCPTLGAFVARVRIAGAAELGAVLMPQLVESFARSEGLNIRSHVTSDTVFSYALASGVAETPVAEFNFDLSDSRSGFSRLFSGEADFVLSRVPLPSEFTLLEQTGTSLPSPRIIALDALTLSVSRGNPVRSVPLSALTGVLTGEIKSWQELGGPDLPLQLSGPLLSAYETTPSIAELIEYAEKTGTAVPIADRIARDSIAVGLTRLSDPGNAVPLRLSGECGSDFLPEPMALKTRDYPLTAPQFLYVEADRQPRIIRSFLRFLDSDAAAIVVERSGFTNRRISEIPLADQGERLANAVMQANPEEGLSDLQILISTLRGARRLTVTFRFRSGSVELDTQSLADLASLSNRIEAGVWDGKELIFVGFSDGDGNADANRRISIRRANAVRAAVRETAGLMDPSQLVLSTEGFGEAMPLACDDTETGRGINRRVELWVRDTPVQN